MKEDKEARDRQRSLKKRREEQKRAKQSKATQLAILEQKKTLQHFDREDFDFVKVYMQRRREERF